MKSFVSKDFPVQRQDWELFIVMVFILRNVFWTLIFFNFLINFSFLAASTIYPILTESSVKHQPIRQLCMCRGAIWCSTFPRSWRLPREWQDHLHIGWISEAVHSLAAAERWQQCDAVAHWISADHHRADDWPEHVEMSCCQCHRIFGDYSQLLSRRYVLVHTILKDGVNNTNYKNMFMPALVHHHIFASRSQNSVWYQSHVCASNLCHTWHCCVWEPNLVASSCKFSTLTIPPLNHNSQGQSYMYDTLVVLAILRTNTSTYGPRSFALLGQQAGTHYNLTRPWRNPVTRTISTQTENVAVLFGLWAWLPCALLTV